MTYNRAACYIAAVSLLIIPGALPAQRSFLGSVSPLRQDGRGIQFTGVSVNSGYSSQAYGLGGYSLLSGSATGAVVDYGISTGASWDRNRSWGSAGFLYSFSYNRMHGRETVSSSALSQSLSYSIVRTFGAKVNFRVGIDATQMDIEQSLFRQSASGRIASVGATFDDLVGMILAGRVDPVLAVALPPPLLVDSPVRGLLYGTRMLGASARMGLSYAATSRMTIAVDGSCDRAMPLPDSDSSRDTANYQLVRSTNVTGSLSISYALSPRTFVGAALSTSRMMSNYQDTYRNMATVSLGRTLSQRWFVQGSAGAGSLWPVREVVTLPRNVQWTASGALGYKTYAHTFVVSGSRSLGDAFGIGGGANVGVSGAWTWNRPGRSWTLETTISQQRITGSVFANPNSVQANVAFARRLTGNTSISVNYVHFRTNAILNPTDALSDVYERNIHAVRLGLHWTPGPGGLW